MDFLKSFLYLLLCVEGGTHHIELIVNVLM